MQNTTSKSTSKTIAQLDQSLIHHSLLITLDDCQLGIIKSLRLEQKINDHVRIFFTALLDAKTVKKEEYVKQLNSQSKIGYYSGIDKKTKKLLTS